MTKEKEDELFKKIPEPYCLYVKQLGTSQKNAVLEKIDDGYRIDKVGSLGVLVNMGFRYFWVIPGGTCIDC